MVSVGAMGAASTGVEIISVTGSVVGAEMVSVDAASTIGVSVEDVSVMVVTSEVKIKVVLTLFRLHYEK